MGGSSARMSDISGGEMDHMNKMGLATSVLDRDDMIGGKNRTGTGGGVT
jgi:hypothetical protein